LTGWLVASGDGVVGCTSLENSASKGRIGAVAVEEEALDLRSGPE
jgi:hypothetical protein